MIDAYPLCCCLIGQHTWIKLYSRPWRRFFRKRVFNCCIYCGNEEDVDLKRRPEIRVAIPD